MTANARSQLFTLTAAMLGGAVAAGIQATAGAAWVLRVGTLIYLAAMFLALRLPDQVDSPPAPAAPGSGRRWPAARFLPERAWAIRPGRRHRPRAGRTRLGDGRTIPFEPPRPARRTARQAHRRQAPNA